jgi:MSHA biogenesis protein MshP
MKALRGFAILSAIFILVVLAALGAFILSISSQQQIGSALDVQGVRAAQAARAGVEWGMYQVNAFGAPPEAASPTAYNFSYGNPATAVGAVSANLRSCANASGSFSVFGFTVTVTCSATADGSGGPTVYSLTSTACSEPSAGVCPNTTNPGNYYIERRMTATF